MTDIVVMTRRGLLLMVRSPTTVVTAALMPTILLLLMSISFGKMVMPEADLAGYVQYAAPVFATMGVVFGSLSTAVAAHQDRVSGFDDRLRTLPMSAAAPLAGRIVADIARNAATLVIITAVALALGFRFQNSAVGVLVYFVLPLILGFGVAWFMVTIAMLADSAESVISALNAALLLLTFFSTGFVMRGDLPGWAQPIASANPISHIAAAMRAATSDGGVVFGSDAYVTIGWAVGLTVVFAPLSIWTYRRRR